MHDEPCGSRASHPGEELDFREISLQAGSPSRRRPGSLDRLPGAFYVIDDPVNPFGVWMVSVVAQLVPYVEEYQHAGREADCEADDIYKCVGGIPEQVSYGYGEVVVEH